MCPLLLRYKAAVVLDPQFSIVSESARVVLAAILRRRGDASWLFLALVLIAGHKNMVTLLKIW